MENISLRAKKVATELKVSSPTNTNVNNHNDFHILGGLKALANNIAEDHYMAMNFYEKY